MLISSRLKDEISKIRQKFLNVDYSLRFVNSIIKQFNDKLREKSNEENDYILPPDFLEIRKQVILIEVPYCEKNETHKRFLKKFPELTYDLYDIKIKSKSSHPACVICKRICACKENYIGEKK